ncbi:hypothetical protein CHS0354_011847, partial [Potamilus streckersoni]
MEENQISLDSVSTFQDVQVITSSHVCNKASTILTIMHNTTVSHPNAPACVNGDHRSSEALVFVNCNTTSTATWRRGENVVTACTSIAQFTPIATFKTDGAYIPNGGTA